MDKSGFIKILSAAVIVTISMLAVTCDEDKEKDSNEQLLPLMLLSGRPLLLYNAGTHDGNLGGRSGADAICNASVNKPIDATNVHAFISISGTDEIRDMPGKYGYSTRAAIYGPDGTSLIANNWADMLDGSINMTLITAGVMPSAHWLGGSWDKGQIDTSYNQCNGFIDNSHTNLYSIGWSDYSDEIWIMAMSDYCDVSTHYILCICKQ